MEQEREVWSGFVYPRHRPRTGVPRYSPDSNKTTTESTGTKRFLSMRNLLRTNNFSLFKKLTFYDLDGVFAVMQLVSYLDASVQGLQAQHSTGLFSLHYSVQLLNDRWDLLYLIGILYRWGIFWCVFFFISLSCY